MPRGGFRARVSGSLCPLEYVVPRERVVVSLSGSVPEHGIWDAYVLVEVTDPRAAVTAKNDFVERYKSISVSYLFLGPFWDVIFFCEDASFKFIDIKWLIVPSYYF